MAKRNKKIIASDLDGTLICEQKNPLSDLATKKFNQIIKENKKNIILVYATGRHLELALRGTKESGLVLPDFLVCDVGTNIYKNRNKQFILDEKWKKKLKKSWSGYLRSDIKNFLLSVPELKEQEKEKQKEFKQSYYLATKFNFPKIKKKIEKALPKNLNPKIIYSLDRHKKTGLIDILPEAAAKKEALKYLAKEIKAGKNIFYAGDSGNDLDVFLSGIKSILVKEAGKEAAEGIKKTEKKRVKIYRAKRPYSLGVIEGLAHFGAVKSKKKGLYIQMHSMHGLFRSKNPELGKDEDTGGQITYVLELAKALGRRPEVERVDIITKKIVDPKYPGYDKNKEIINKKVNLIRISCGPDRYIKKIKLWPYLDEFIENTKKFIADLGRIPDILHSNYADSGFVCTKLSQDLGIPQVHTGHSLGIPKMKRMGITKKNFKKADEKFHFSKRVPAEQATIDCAQAIVISSEQEKEIQYGFYKVKDYQKFSLVEPGFDSKKFKPFNKVKEAPFFKIKEPAAISLSRLDKRKNLSSLAKAYQKDKNLCQISRLIIFSSSLNDKIAPEEEKNVVAAIKKEIQKLKNKKSVALQGIKSKDVSKLYRTAARSGGVFVNPAFVEPFGLTLLEAGASGLPVVATKNGGPETIIKNCKNGILIDPKKPKEIAAAIKKIITDKKKWEKFSKNGIKNVKKTYSWERAAKEEVKLFQKVIREFF